MFICQRKKNPFNSLIRTKDWVSHPQVNEGNEGLLGPVLTVWSPLLGVASIWIESDSSS